MILIKARVRVRVVWRFGCSEVDDEGDDMQFHGKVLTVKLVDGRRLKGKMERERWIEGDDGVEYRSKWHEERERLRKEFRKVVETEQENWQAVVEAFQKMNNLYFSVILLFL